MLSRGNSLRFVFVLSLLLVLVAFGWENEVSYQGKLTDAAGIGITDNLDIHFRIYDGLTGGSMLDSATVEDVVIEKGLFSANIPFDLTGAEVAGDMYLEIWVDTDPMSPRQKMSAELFAFAAHYADSSGAINWSDIHDIPTSLGGFKQLRGEGGTWLEDSATFVAGSGVTVTQDGDTIIIEASGAASLQEAFDGGNTIEIAGAGDPVDIERMETGVDTDDSDTPLEVRNDDDEEPAIYAYNSADGPAIYSSGHLRMSGTATVRIYSTADLNLQVDRGDDTETTTQSFIVRDGVDNEILNVNEDRFAQTGNLILDEIAEEIDPTKVVTVDGANQLRWADFPSGASGDYIEDQFTAAQDAEFWIGGRGQFGYDTEEIFFEDDFSTDEGWTLDAGEWERDACAGLGSSGYSPTPADPSEDVTSSSTDNMVLGYDLTGLGSESGNYENGMSATEWATSPVIDCGASVPGQPIILQFWRKLGVEHSDWDHAYIEVFDGTDWITIWENPSGYGYSIADPEWTLIRYDVTDYASGNSDFQVRFGMGTSDGSNNYFGWNIDDLVVRTFADMVTVDAGDVSSNSLTLNSETIESWDDFIRNTDTLRGVNVDTIVAMNDFKVHGELIADSIQAVGDTVHIDDNTRIHGDLYGECATFETRIPSYDIFIEEGFEGTTFPPTGWTQNYVVGTIDWVQSMTNPHTGSLCAEFSHSSWSGYVTELITPSMDLSGYSAGEITLSFWHMQEAWGSDQDTLAVYYSTDGGSSWNFIESWNSDIDSYVREEYVLPDLSSDYMIKFYGYQDYGFGVRLDDVLVRALTGVDFVGTDICEGNILADGDVEAESFTLDGTTITSWPTGGGLADPVIADTVMGGDHDTIVVMNDFKVVGELIADSIQAVGDVIEMDDDIHVHGDVITDGGFTPDGTDFGAASQVITADGSGGWSWEDVTGGSADADWSYIGTTDDMYNTDLGNISIGQSTSPAIANRLEVYGTGETTEKAVVGISTTGPEGWLGTANYGAYGQYNSTNYGGLGMSGYGVQAAGDVYAGQFIGDVEVQGDIKINDGITTDGTDYGTTGQVLTADGTGGWSWEDAAGGADADWNVVGTDMTSGVTGNILVNTATSTDKVVIKGDDNNVLRLLGIDGEVESGARISFGDEDYVYIEESNDDDLKLFADYDISLISSYGNIGIQTEIPAYTLDVNGDTKIGGGIIDPTNASGTAGQVATADGSGSWSWEDAAGGSGAVSLQDAYDEGNTITIGTAGEIDIDAPESAPGAGDGGRALDVTGDDDTQDGVFRAYNAGDGPAIFSSGHLRINGAKKFYSTTDLKFQLDQGGSASNTNSFDIRDDADANVVTIDETGVVELHKAPYGDNNARTDWEAEYVITVGQDNADFNMLQNAITYANGLGALAGVVIEVAPGQYRVPDVTLNDGIVVKGSGSDNTVVVAIDVATFTITAGAAIHDMNMSIDVSSEGEIHECDLSSVTLNSGKMVDCIVEGLTTVMTETKVVIEGCDLVGFDITGMTSISDCAIDGSDLSTINAGSNVHMTGCEYMGMLFITGEGTNLYAEGNTFMMGEVSLDGYASGEFKSNHFIQMTDAIRITNMASANIIANDFISTALYGVHVELGQKVRIMNNSFDGNSGSMGQTGIKVDDTGVLFELTISGNSINNHTNAGIEVGALLEIPLGKYVISHNNITGNGVGASITPSVGLFTHNNVIGNTMNDLMIGSPMIVSYNTVQNHLNITPATLIPGSYNQDQTGTPFTGGTNPGQLP